MMHDATLTRLYGLAESGRNQPIRAAIRDQQTTTHEAYVKAAGWRELTASSVMREYAAACVAGLLGLPVCRPFWIDCPAPLFSTSPDGGTTCLGDCDWPAFGSGFAGPQWRNWISTEAVHPEAMQMALNIFAFDAFIDNPDRRGPNPNLLVKGDQFRIIDHELAFSFLDLLFPAPPPWVHGSLDWMTDGDREHILYSVLKQSAGLDFAGVHDSWAALNDGDIDAVVAGLPQSLSTVKPALGVALKRVKDVRDNIGDACIELERILS